MEHSRIAMLSANQGFLCLHATNHQQECQLLGCQREGLKPEAMDEELHHAMLEELHLMAQLQVLKMELVSLHRSGLLRLTLTKVLRIICQKDFVNGLLY